MMRRLLLTGLALALLVGASAHAADHAAEAPQVAQMGVTPAPTPDATKPPHTRPESGKEPLGDPAEAHPDR